MQNKITLALFLGSASAVSGPRPDQRSKHTFVTGNSINLGTASNQLYVWTNTEIAAISDNATARTAMTSDSKTTGLYGCLRQGYLGLPPQHLQGIETGSGTSKYEVEVQAYVSGTNDTKRVFYTQDDATNGYAPVAVGDQNVTGGKYEQVGADKTYSFPTIDITANSPNGNGAFGQSPAPATDDPKNQLQIINADVTECCVQSSTSGGYDLFLLVTCISLTQMEFDNSYLKGTYVPGRIAVFETLSNGIYNLGSGTTVPNYGADRDSTPNTQSGYDKDFILGATGQRSNDSSGNWCDPKFAVASADMAADGGKTLTAGEGFNVKTKCTWQLKAQASKAPQFELTSATQTSFFIQWIDNTNEAVTDDTYLPQSLDAILGDYSDGIYFNPFKQGLATGNVNLGATPGTGTETDHSNPDSKFNPTTTFTNTLDASIGHVNYWLVDGENAKLAAENVDFNLFSVAEAVMETVYTEYSGRVDDYNDLAKKYNDAYELAKTDNTAVVPDLPCPPTLPTNGNKLDFKALTTNYDTAKQQSALNGSIKKDTIYYVPLDTTNVGSSSDAKYDARRLGNLYTNAVEPTSFTSSADAFDPTGNWSVGHVYGRLGQGEMNMPGESDAWRFDSNESSVAVMNVSIFPEQGFGNTPFTSEQSIVITATEASFTTEPYVAAVSSAKEIIPTANAVAMGLSVAALAVSASLF